MWTGAEATRSPTAVSLSGNRKPPQGVKQRLRRRFAGAVGVSGALNSQDGGASADALHEEEAYPEEDVEEGKDGFPVKRKRSVRPGEQIPTMDPKHPHVKVGRYVVDDVAYNTRGYQVCGFVNQRGTLCGRIGMSYTPGTVEFWDRQLNEPATPTLRV